ncbi:MAG: hypothetical protein ACJAVL_001830 [Bacteroidia bacterium]|jgi:hypothetical protein
MKKGLLIYVSLLGLVATVISSCQVHSKADFDLELDPVVPGKVNLINKSSNAKNFQWVLGLSETEFGTYGISSQYGNYGYYDGEITHFYIQENTWIEVSLEASGLTSSTQIKKLHVNNIPTQVVMGDLVVTSVNMRDVTGFEWDDTDGTPNSGSYDVEGEYPDLLVNNSSSYTTYPSSNVVWNVNIETGLPVVLTTEHHIFDNLSGFGDTDYYVELVDFDGQASSIFLEPGKRIGVVNIDLYRLTHKQNGGSDDNYPEIYKILEDGFEADLYMNWD